MFKPEKINITKKNYYFLYMSSDMSNVLPPSFRVIPTLKMEAARSSQVLAGVYNITASHTRR